LKGDEVHSFLIHNQGDDVAVAIRDVSEGSDVVAVAMDTGTDFSIITSGRIPLGHKIALKDLPEGSEVRKYGIRIGTTTADIVAGDHVHTHNLRSSRW
jgi:(2R)-sulfolactate sulfo-lyase subunit alpha